AAAAHAALPGAPNIQYCGPRREFVLLDHAFCLAASWTAWYSPMLPALGLPGAPLVPPWLIVRAFWSWAWSRSATLLPSAVMAFFSQSYKASWAVVPTSRSARAVS